MGMRKLQIVMLIAAAGVLLALPSPASASNFHHCSGAHQKVFHADRMRANGSCHVAHAVAKRLFRNWLDGNHSHRAGFTVAGRKWKTQTHGSGLPYVYVRCHSGAKKVRFRAYSIAE
jgi:hypothetical protein